MYQWDGSFMRVAADDRQHSARPGQMERLDDERGMIAEVMDGIPTMNRVKGGGTTGGWVPVPRDRERGAGCP